MATPSLAMIPSAYADSKVYSVLPNNGDGDFTFNRDSSATRVGSNGLIQTVGFFGSELITNGSFATDSDWSKGTGWTISGGKASQSGGVGQLSQTIGISTGVDCKIEITVTVTAGTIRISPGPSGIGANFSVSGTYSFNGSFVGNSILYILGTSSSFVGSISNISIKEIQGDQPRLNYDINANGQVQSCPSLLLEGASTNSVPYSEDFTQSAWTKSGSTVSSNQAISPDGTLTADKLVEDTSNGGHQIFDTVITASGDFSNSIFVKSAERSKIRINYGNNNGRVDFDLSNGTIISQAGATGNIVSMSGGWYRCDMSWNMSSVNAQYILIALLDNSGNTSYQGDGTSGVYIWGAQLEQQSYPTSYIPTLSGASQTRAAESCQKTGLTNYIGQTEGTLYAEIDFKSHPEAGSPIVGIVTLNNNVSNLQNCIVLGIERLAGGVNRFYPIVQVGNSTVASVIGSTLTDGIYKAAFAYKLNDFVLYVNGVQIGVDNSGAVPTTSQVLLAERKTNDSVVFGDGIKSTQIFKTRLTNAQLQTLTT